MSQNALLKLLERLAGVDAQLLGEVSASVLIGVERLDDRKRGNNGRACSDQPDQLAPAQRARVFRGLDRDQTGLFEVVQREPHDAGVGGRARSLGEGLGHGLDAGGTVAQLEHHFRGCVQSVRCPGSLVVNNELTVDMLGEQVVSPLRRHASLPPVSLSGKTVDRSRADPLQPP